MTTVWGIKNIKEIGIASYNDKYWLINPDIFNDIVANKKVNDADKDNGIAPQKDQWYHDPVAGYEITQIDLNELSKGILPLYDYNTENISRGDTAWHSDSSNDKKSGYFEAWGGRSSNDEYTEFYKLFWKECKKFTDRGFKCFNGNCYGGIEFDAKNWIYVDLSDTSYTGYLRVFYRTWDDFYSFINCSTSENLTKFAYYAYPECNKHINNNPNYKVYLEQNIPSINSSNKKRCDIVVYKNKEPYLIFPTKIIMTNYKQNKNNSWENLTGELMHLKWANKNINIIFFINQI